LKNDFLLIPAAIELITPKLALANPVDFSVFEAARIVDYMQKSEISKTLKI